MLLSWPAIIALSYVAIRLVLRAFEKKQEKFGRELEREL
jgi:hypothetical protein